MDPSFEQPASIQPQRAIPESIGRSLGDIVQWSIVQEASARKAGNVHPEASFANMDYSVFVAAAHAIGDAMDRSIDSPLGKMIFECVAAMHNAAGTNTSLGTILLLAPLAMYRQRMKKSPFVEGRLLQFIAETTSDDSDWIYRAIVSCSPGGLGTSREMDLLGPAPDSILEAMKHASERDDVALQYCNGYREVLDYARRVSRYVVAKMPLLDAIRYLQLQILSERADSLIVRKCGHAEGRNVQQRAQQVLRSGSYGEEVFEANWLEFDWYLRSDGHRKNPGTTADLIAAALFVSRTSHGVD